MADLSRVVHFTGVRLSFPNLIEPQRQKDPVTGDERVSYNASLLVEPNSPDFAKFMALVQQLAADKWKEQAGALLQHIQRDTKGRCYAMGEEKVNSKTLKPYDGYAGMIVISVGSKTQPQMVDGAGNVVDPANTMAVQAVARKMYAGSRVNVALKPWLQENKHGRAVRCELVGIQFAKDDTPFGEGHIDLTGAFGAVESPPGFAGAPWSPPATSAPTFGAPATSPPQFGAPATAPPSFM